jgi:hypothetical protein
MGTLWDEAERCRAGLVVYIAALNARRVSCEIHEYMSAHKEAVQAQWSMGWQTIVQGCVAAAEFQSTLLHGGEDDDAWEAASPHLGALLELRDDCENLSRAAGVDSACRTFAEELAALIRSLPVGQDSPSPLH